MLSCCRVSHAAHSRIAIISLIFQLNARYIFKYVHFYKISPKCFGTYCTILREKFVSLAQNYLLLFAYLVVPYCCIGFEQFLRYILIVVNCPYLLSINNYEIALSNWYEDLPEDGAVRTETCRTDLVKNICNQSYNVHFVEMLKIYLRCCHASRFL